jgi:hypothetical protein
MAQKGKQMRVGAREGFAYHSMKRLLLANGNKYEVDSNLLFQVLKPSIYLKYRLVSILTVIKIHLYL